MKDTLSRFEQSQATSKTELARKEKEIIRLSEQKINLIVEKEAEATNLNKVKIQAAVAVFLFIYVYHIFFK